MIRIILLLAGLTAFPPASTDMYLPAIPLLGTLWDEPLSRINLALVSFFIAFSFAILFFGPISDRFGRKPPLVVGIALYCVGTLLCAVAEGVDAMIAYRSLQGFGAGSAAAISVAMAKDRFVDERQRGQVLAYIAMAMAITPMLAPMIGAAILELATWPYIFYGQAVFGAIMLVATLAMQETLTHTVDIRLKAVFKRYITLFSNLLFLTYMFIGSLLMASMFAFIASSSTIYQTQMQVSATEYSLLFAF
ncbi:MAG: MFS transporter, partial [Pseudomonadota bacterium]